MGTPCLVTGGAGFIGSHLTRRLLQEGRPVRVLDNFATGSPANLEEVRAHLDLIEGDLRDPEACRRACQGVETVFHLGALGSVPRSIEDPATSHAVNVTGTLNLLIAARAAGVRRVVFSSSSSVYGDTEVLPKQEEMRPHPRSPYAVSKLAGEEYCRAFFHSFGLETVCLRYFNVFGPRQNPASQYAAVIPRFITALLRNEAPVIFGDGTQSRDFTYVSNVVDANVLAACAPGAAGGIFNVACGEQVTLLEVLVLLQQLVGTTRPPRHLAARAGDVRHSHAAIDRAREALGYRPSVLFAEGLALTVRAFRESLPVAA